MGVNIESKAFPRIQYVLVFKARGDGHGFKWFTVTTAVTSVTHYPYIVAVRRHYISEKRNLSYNLFRNLVLCLT